MGVFLVCFIGGLSNVKLLGLTESLCKIKDKIRSCEIMEVDSIYVTPLPEVLNGKKKNYSAVQ